MGCVLPVPLSKERVKVIVNDSITSARKLGCADLALALQTSLYKGVFTENLSSTRR